MNEYKSEASRRWYETMREKFGTDDEGVKKMMREFGEKVDPENRGFAVNKEAAKRAAQTRWKDHKKKGSSD